MDKITTPYILSSLPSNGVDLASVYGGMQLILVKYLWYTGVTTTVILITSSHPSSHPYRQKAGRGR